MRNIKMIDRDYDYSVSEKIITGRITKARYKIISAYARKNTWHNSCGCEYDCCGHLSSVSTRIISANSNQVTLRVSENYNY